MEKIRKKISNYKKICQIKLYKLSWLKFTIFIISSCIILFPILSIILGRLTRCNILYLTTNYNSLLSKMMIFLVTILFIAISFKRVSIWQMSFIAYLKYRHKTIISLVTVSVVIYMVYILLLMNNIILPLLVEVILLDYVLICLISGICIIFSELYNSGDMKQMNENVRKIFLEHPYSVQKTIDFDHNINDEKYYSFIDSISTNELTKLFYKVVTDTENVTNFEYMLLCEHIIRRKEDGATDTELYKKNGKYIAYLNELTHLNEDVLFACASSKLIGEEYRKAVLEFKKLISSGSTAISNLFDPNVHRILINNDTLIDELIVYAMEDPNREKEQFLYDLLESSITNSATYTKDNVIYLSTKENQKYYFMQVNDVICYYKDLTIINSLNYSRYELFLESLNSFSGVELLNYLQTIFYEDESGNTDISGLYSINYVKIKKAFYKFGFDINITLKEVPLTHESVDIKKIFFDTVPNFKTINYLNITQDIQNKLKFKIKELESTIKDILIPAKVEEKKARERIIKQIEISNDVSIEVFLKLYNYIIEDKNKNIENLSESFFLELRGLFTNYDLTIYKGLERYIINFNFILYDKFVRKFKNYNRMNFSIPNDDKAIPLLPNEGMDNLITYADAYAINYGVSLIQSYIDTGIIPELVYFYSDDNNVPSIIEGCCNKIIELYSSDNKKKVYHNIPGYSQFKILNIDDNKLKPSKKINNVVTGNIVIKYENRTVFSVLLKLLLNIESNFVYNSERKYEVKIKKLLDEMGIEYIHQDTN